MSEEDKIIWKILCTAAPIEIQKQLIHDDVIDTLDHISVLEFTTNYKRYANSFRRFKITGEEFFSVLYQINKRNELFTETENQIDNLNGLMIE